MIRMSLGTKTSLGSIYFEGLFNLPCLNRPLKIECIRAPPLRESIHPLLPKNVFLLAGDFFEMNERRLDMSTADGRCQSGLSCPL